MTSLTDHQEFVEQHPFDKVAALALADRLQEEANASRWDALKFVASLRKPGRDAKFLARAARVMRARTLAKTELDAVIEDVAGLRSYDTYHVFLLRGFGRPRIDAGSAHPNPLYDADPIVFIGVRWIISYYSRLVKIGRYCAMAERHLRRHS